MMSKSFITQNDIPSLWLKYANKTTLLFLSTSDTFTDTSTGKECQATNIIISQCTMKPELKMDTEMKRQNISYLRIRNWSTNWEYLHMYYYVPYWKCTVNLLD